eukprot:TRINITY_DN17236_c0_g1_i1.p1 TRINITY_DN17236_c0_g1~~TRINITY_DN17236_c0_g1_i1.p1  ORF type:complete len:645 (-),score=107.40 TRINITY_DN17236_c0_g1_i1:684-2618(-)
MVNKPSNFEFRDESSENVSENYNDQQKYTPNIPKSLHQATLLAQKPQTSMKNYKDNNNDNSNMKTNQKQKTTQTDIGKIKSCQTTPRMQNKQSKESINCESESDDISDEDIDQLESGQSQTNEKNSEYILYFPNQHQSRQVSNNINSQILNLSRKGMDTFTEQITSRIDTILFLDIGYNKLRTIPTEIIQLKQLSNLKLDSNFIKFLPSWLFTHLTNIRIFSISNNLLYTITPDIKLWKNSLTLLDVSVNRIEDLCQEICDLVNLNVILINQNDFKYFPVKFYQLKELKSLNFDWFKYLNPPMKSCLEQENGLQAVREFLNTLQNNEKITHNSNNSNNKQQSFGVYNEREGFLNFHQFVTIFSKNKFDIDTFDENSKRNLIHIAALEEDLGALSSMLQIKPTLINQLDINKLTPLNLSLLYEKYFSAKLLIMNQANLIIGGGIYGSVLNLAVSKSQSYLVNEMLIRGADPNARDQRGNNGLHIVFSQYQANIDQNQLIALQLLRSGVNPNQKNFDGWCPIHIAIQKHQVEAIKFMIYYNRSVMQQNLQLKQFDLNKKGGFEKLSPLHLSVANCNLQIIDILIDNGVNFHSTNIKNQTAQKFSMRDLIIYKKMKLFEKNTEKEVSLLGRNLFTELQLLCLKPENG